MFAYTKSEPHAKQSLPTIPLILSSDGEQARQLTHPRYRPDIDGLRAVAVLSVVGFHAFPDWVKSGFIGVDIFFVISGFLISTIIFENLERNSFNFAEFYSRRIRRIFPALLIVLIASFAIGWVTLLPDEYKQLGKHIAGGAGFISNFVLWNESGYFDHAANTKPLLHLWSLGIEEQFYIVYPLLLWLAWKFRLKLVTVTGAIALISFGLTITKYKADAVADFYSPLTRFWELMIGSVLAYGQLRRQDRVAQFESEGNPSSGMVDDGNRQRTNGSNLGKVQSILGTIFIAIGLIVVTTETHFPGWWALFPTLGAALVISAGAQAWINRSILSNRILVWFGLISFPLYLWHWVLLCFARIAEGEMPILKVRIAIVLVSIVFAWLTYKLVEKPLRFGKHSHAKAASLLVLMAGIGYVGYGTYVRDGLAFRFPKLIQELTQFRYDYKHGYREGSCFLRPDQDYTAFDSCEARVDTGKKILVLWGDSHAAHLYPGYEANFSGRFNIIQRTASQCPPILNLDDMYVRGRPLCRKINDHVINEIGRLRPEKVVLAAEWSPYDWKKLDATIFQLKRSGVGSIDIVGPVPIWQESLPRQIYLYFKSDIFHRVPDRMKLGLVDYFLRVDTEMSEFSSKAGVTYLSPAKVLCNEAGCITRFGDTGDSLSAFDEGHLTYMGSTYLVSNFPKN